MENESQGVKNHRIVKMEWAIPMVFTYALGISLVHYLGGNINIVDLVFGSIICLLIFTMRAMLNAYFDHPESPQSTLNKVDPARGMLNEYKRNLLLQISLLILTAGATLTVILTVRQVLTIPGIVYLGLALLGYFFSAAPPLRLDRTGYGDLVEGIVTVNLVPAFAMSLQGIDVPFLLLQLSLPLLLVFLAARIAFSFRQYGLDSMYDRKSLVTQIGWQNAVILHNLLILGAFVLIGVLLLAGLSWSLSWPMLLALPLGAWQIWQMTRIAEGAKPDWKIFLWMAMGLFLVMVYLVLVALWT